MFGPAIRKKWIAWSVAAVICSVVFVSLSFGSLQNTLWQWAPRGKDTHMCAPGIWGRVWFERSLIEIPPDRIQIQSVNPKPVKWYIEANSSAELVAILRTCGLEEGQVQELLLTMVRATNGVGRILSPSTELVLSLGETVRLKLYTVLGRYSQNEAEAAPFRFSGATVSDWLDDAKVDPDVVKMVRTLIYHQGQSQMFSDMDLVLSRFPSVSVYSNLFMTLARESTLVARVRVMPGDDVDELARYWGAPNRESEVRTLLKTMQNTENCRNVPVSLLLPPFARDRIYRYWHAGDPDFANCHYTAMNFFNQVADARFTDLKEVAQTLARDYSEVQDGNYRLGDVILLMKSETEAIHSCNYVADRIVFTRNGGSMAQPWMLTTLDALVDFYSYPDPVRIKVMRRRDLARL